MQELVGRLTSLDAEATKTLEVIAYFDALIDGNAHADVLLRGAAILSGCAAGFVAGGRSMRVDASGARSREAPDTHRRPATDGPASTGAGWPSHRFGDGAIVWIERDGPAHANDAMILERFAIALHLALGRMSPSTALRRALETLIDHDSSADARAEAVERLRLDPLARHRVVVVPASSALPGPSLVVGSAAGQVRVAVRTSDAVDVLDRAGIGLAVEPDRLDRSWVSGLTALRLTTAHHAVVEADQLGALLVLAEGADASRETDPDTEAVTALIGSQPRMEELLDAVAGNDSVRAVAREIGLHHSTVQARIAALAAPLGYDVRSPNGRTRLALALAMHRLATNRFA